MPSVTIRPAGDSHLPSANTCISRLYIPLYSSKAILRYGQIYKLHCFHLFIIKHILNKTGASFSWPSRRRTLGSSNRRQRSNRRPPKISVESGGKNCENQNGWRRRRNRSIVMSQPHTFLTPCKIHSTWIKQSWVHVHNSVCSATRLVEKNSLTCKEDSGVVHLGWGDIALECSSTVLLGR